MRRKQGTSLNCENCNGPAEVITLELEDKSVNVLCWRCLFAIFVDLVKQVQEEPLSGG